MRLSRDEYLTRAREFASRGNARPNARLNPEIVKAIRANVRGKSARKFAEELGVHIRTVEKVQRFETWGHV